MNTAFGMVNDGNRVIVFRGMKEYSRCSNETYELNVTSWEWKKLNPGPADTGKTPKPRYGHSFNLIGNRTFMFGGMAISNLKEKPQYLNDLYSIELRDSHGVRNWTVPKTHGILPSPRDFHIAVSYQTKGGSCKLLIHGEKHRSRRLSDVYVLDIDSCTWSAPKVRGVPPLPRTLHTSTLLDDKLYVFGGLIPRESPVSSQNQNLPISCRF